MVSGDKFPGIEEAVIAAVGTTSSVLIAYFGAITETILDELGLTPEQKEAFWGRVKKKVDEENERLRADIKKRLGV